MATITNPTKVRWNEVKKVGMPSPELRNRKNGACAVPRTFLCRGEWSLFTSYMSDDGSGFTEERDDKVTAWAVIEGH